MPRIAFALALIVSLGCDPEGTADAGPADHVGGKADGAGASTSAWPPYVKLVNNSRQAHDPPKPAYVDVQLPTVSGPALDDALSELAGDLAFADYPFSGCHDRAHATYLHLARSLGAHAVAKVWVLSPTLLTVALEGAIEGPVGDPGWGVAHTSWAYHVAAVVRGPSGLRVVDPVLADLDDPLSLDEWFSAMAIPPGSAYTVLEGRFYSFNTAGPSSWSGGRMPFNGSMFEYVGLARADRWLEENLARDAVAAALLDGAGCSYLRQVLLDPQSMVLRLDEMAAGGTSATCQPYLDVYLDQRAAWADTIDVLLAG
jgi:hypothetical protein